MVAELPFIDEHHIDCPAAPEQLWNSLVSTFGSAGQGIFSAYAKVIGAEPDQVSGELDQAGSTRIGFRASEVDAPNRLLLTGRHRFSEYSLEWQIEPLATGADSSTGGSRLTAITRARFPGLHGRAYKAMVIDSGAHARVTRRMLHRWPTGPSRTPELQRLPVERRAVSSAGRALDRPCAWPGS